MTPRHALKARTRILLAVLLLVPAQAACAAPAPNDTVFTVPFDRAAAAIPLADETPDGYTRTSFKHWTDADKDGCDTRKEVILAEAVADPVQGKDCRLSGGTWLSLYDQKTVHSDTALDVDHFVPLKEAWRSGANRWSAAKREKYANDLGDSRTLIAVTAATNRSKADRDIANWKPPAPGTWCTYAADWAAVKLRWGLSANWEEKNTLQDILQGCPRGVITGTAVR